MPAHAGPVSPGFSANPPGVEPAEGVLKLIQAIVGLATPVLALAVVGSLVLRFRHSGGDERQQLKWRPMSVVAVDVVMLPALGRPQTNGCVERVQQAILEECWKPAFARYLIPKQTGRRLDLERYLHDDNTEGSHTGRWTRGPTPEAVLGKAKLWQKKR